MTEQNRIEKAYQLAKEQYSSLGVDTDKVLSELDKTLLLVCTAGKLMMLEGLKNQDAELGGGGIQVTGNFPGKAQTIDQMRADLDKVMSLLPGEQRLNLHAIYGEFGRETC